MVAELVTPGILRIPVNTPVSDLSGCEIAFVILFADALFAPCAADVEFGNITPNREVTGAVEVPPDGLLSMPDNAPANDLSCVMTLEILLVAVLPVTDETDAIPGCVAPGMEAAGFFKAPKSPGIPALGNLMRDNNWPAGVTV